MRLTCPRCGAQYEIDAAAIPAAGRDVECSACSHVWHAVPATQGAAPFDPADRPTLNRPLNESILSVLREEAARELQARQGQARPPEQAPSGTQPAPQTAPQTGTQTGAPAAAADWPATTLTHPTPRPSADILAQRMERDFGQAEGAVDLDLDADADADADAQPGAQPGRPAGPPGTPAQPQPAAPASTPAAPDDTVPPDAPEPPRLTPHPTLHPAPDPVAPEPVARPAASRPAPPANAARPLPSAAGPVAAGRGRTIHRAPARSRTAYNAGFNLAFMAALVVVTLYALAPRMADQGELGARLMDWRAQADLGRDWLQTRADGLVADVVGGLRR